MRLAIAVARGNPACPFGAVLVDADTLELVCEGLIPSDRVPAGIRGCQR